MVKMPNLRNTFTLMNVSVGLLGIGLGVLPLLGVASPIWLTSAGWIGAGIAGALLLFGKKSI